MRSETPEQKYDRLKEIIQHLTLTSYPNPAREGCPGDAALIAYARRLVLGELVADEAGFEHVTHCSPCYREYLDRLDEVRAEHSAMRPAKKMSWFTQRRLGRTLDHLERVMNSVFRQGSSQS